MPIYEYQCINCGTEFEVLIRTYNNVIRCTKCGSSNVKKLISLCGIKTSLVTSSSSCSSCTSTSCSSCTIK
ncbi:MAG: zinc ribbon domain-containing protein [bacterium]